MGELDLEGGEMVTVWLNGLGKTIGENELGIYVEYLWNTMVITFLKLSPVKTRRQTKCLLSS